MTGPSIIMHKVWLMVLIRMESLHFFGATGSLPYLSYLTCAADACTIGRHCTGWVRIPAGSKT